MKRRNRTSTTRSATTLLCWSALLASRWTGDEASGMVHAMTLQHPSAQGNNVNNQATTQHTPEWLKAGATPSLVGQVLQNQYLLTKQLPFESAGKCQIYEAFPIHGAGGAKQKPLVVKLSANLPGIEWEYENYRRISERMSPAQREAFVGVYDKIDPTSVLVAEQQQRVEALAKAAEEAGATLNTVPTAAKLAEDSASTSSGLRAGIVMEMGRDNLRFQIRKKGAYRGEKLRLAMESVIKIVDSLHSNQLCWTELKAENFVLSNESGEYSIKGIDLESVISTNDLLRVYTAEACPPEFPVDEMYKSLPRMRIDPSFDIWGLGLVLYEMATGKPFYEHGLTDLEYIKDQLRHAPRTLERAHSRLLSVHPKARGIIEACLRLEPSQRPSCEELLADPYFGTSSVGIGVAPARVSITPSLRLADHFGNPVGGGATNSTSLYPAAAF